MSKKAFDIHPLTGSNTANNYSDKENPLYVVTIETQPGFKTHEVKVGSNKSWSSSLSGLVTVRAEDDGNELYVYFGRNDGKAIHLNLSEVSELRILLNLMHKSLPNMLEQYESVKTIKKVEEV